MMRQLLFLFVFGVIFSFTAQAQCISGNCQNGTGIFVYPSGAKYVGQFKNGEIAGIGTCYYTDGSKYQGQWRNRFPEGRGIKTFADGTKWTGQWMKGQPVDENGVVVDFMAGKEIEDDGTSIQSGCIAGDCENGLGTFAYPDGSKYEGNFLEGAISGDGSFYFANGDYYEGAFVNGYAHGKGSMLYADGHRVTGTWEEGEYVGEGSVAADGRTGCLEGDCQNGWGTYVYEDGMAKYTGTFRNGLPEGQGVVHYANGERYEGEWVQGGFEGEGTLFLMDGTAVRGFWKDGTYMGEGVPEVAEVKEESPDWRAIREAQGMKVWAVIVGISAYNHMPALRYTDDDAYRIYAFLKSPEGGALPDERIRILVDEDATKDHIGTAMDDIFGKADSSDLIVLYFSGHGLKGSFLPIDYDGHNNKFLHEEIKERLDQSKAKYKLILADACHSGSLLAMKGVTVENTILQYYKSLAQADPGTALILSSKSDETSLESSGLRQGVFTHFLIRGLKGEADADGNRVVNIEELYTFISENVRSYTANRQTPVIQGEYDPKMTVSVVR